jgi:sugar phosphate permease
METAPASRTPDDSLRSSAFTASWLLYAGYYLCRENLRTVWLLPGTPFLADDLSRLLSTFALAYVLGNLVAGAWADAKGARQVALAGGLISAFSTAAMLLVHIGTGLLWLQLLNGFGQGLGFPALARLLAAWFHREERPGILAWWSASYSLGGILAVSLTIWCATTNFLLPAWGWHRSLILPPLLLALVSLWFYRTTRDDPQSLALAAISPPHLSANWDNGWWSVLASSHIRTISAMYFFLKMTRYAMLFWLPLYLVQTAHASESRAASTVSLFELFGFVGALLAVRISARSFDGRRYPVATLLLCTVGFLSLLEPLIAPFGWWASAANIAAMGMMVYGVDSLMTSIAVLESVPLSHAARSIAVVNGAGSLGQMLAPLLVTWFVHNFGWNNLFNLFLVTSLLGIAVVAPHWNESAEATEEPIIAQTQADETAEARLAR